ncbi:ferritin-like domain-containing protein [Pseudonocardia sp. C8]|uniref:ferritin-like domain-containing protein n=1 Tax=Pseudonocardia sp. C8 TaxID=2762759 RepID=UPI0016425C2D|nr:ferritin-like domain-containing protein [Pseudonocardia sp. C8]
MRAPAQEQDEPAVPAVTVEALQRALASEHAALWAYKMAVAFVPPDWAARARADVEAHTTLRGQVNETLTQLGQRPISAQPAYAPPQPVVDAASAGALLVAAETDAIAAWRSVTERSTQVPLRQAGLRAMIECTGRLAYWRTVTERTPVVPVFPGRS